MRLILPALPLAFVVFFTFIELISSQSDNPGSSRGHSRHTSGQQENLGFSSSVESRRSQQSRLSEQLEEQRHQRHSGLVIPTQPERRRYSAHSSAESSRSPPYSNVLGRSRSRESQRQVEYYLSSQLRHLGGEGNLGRESVSPPLSPQSSGALRFSDSPSPPSSISSHYSSPRGPFAFEFDSFSESSSHHSSNYETPHIRRP